MSAQSVTEIELGDHFLVIFLVSANADFVESPLAAEESTDPLIRWDSYENFNNNHESTHPDFYHLTGQDTWTLTSYHKNHL